MNTAYGHPCDSDPPTSDAAHRVAIYTSARDSSTVDRQQVALQAFLADNQPHWRVVATYRDVAAAGGRTRPGLAQVLAAAAAGEFDVLLVHRLDRLARRMDDMGEVIDQLAATNVAVHTVVEAFGSSSAAFRLLIPLRGALAAVGHESDPRRR